MPLISLLFTRRALVTAVLVIAPALLMRPHYLMTSPKLDLPQLP